MFKLKRGTFILTEGVNDSFRFIRKDFDYDIAKKDQIVIPRITTTSIESMVHRDHKKLVNSVSRRLKNSKISSVEQIEDEYDTTTIVNGSNCFAMLGSYFLNRAIEKDFLVKQLNARDSYYMDRRLYSTNVLSTGQADCHSKEYEKLLSVFRSMMSLEVNFESRTDYYYLLQALFYLCQKSYNSGELDRANQLIKKYGK